MLSEMVGARPCIVIVSRVIDVMSVGLGIRVPVSSVVSVKREEQSVPWSVLLVICVFFISPRSVGRFVHCSFCCRHLILRDHCWVWSLIRSLVPFVSKNVLISSPIGVNKASYEDKTPEVSSEDVFSLKGGLNLREVMIPSWVSDGWNASTSSLLATTIHYSKWASKSSSNQEVETPFISDFSLHFSVVLPWPSLWASHQLSESWSDPRFMQELLIQPKIEGLSDWIKFNTSPSKLAPQLG